MAIRALAFDADGVLVRAGVFSELLEREHGVAPAAISAFFEGPFVDCVLGRRDLEEAIAPFLTEWGWQATVQDCLQTWFEADSVTDDRVLEAVAEVRAAGLACYLVSNQERHRAAYLEEVLGFGARFDGLFYSSRIGARKPQAAFFEHVVSHVGVAPSEILLIDDHPANVEGARSLGWHAALFSWGDDVRQLLHDHGVHLSDA